MKLPFETVCIDIETTDLNSTTGSIIQIGAIMLDKRFNEIDSFNSYVKPLDSHRNSDAMRVNNISEETLSTAPTLQEVLILFESFAQTNVEEKNKAVLASWPSHFDIPFLKKQYGKIKRQWPFDYRSLDLKSIATWEMSKKDIDLQTSSHLSDYVEKLNLKIKGTTHDALSDIRASVDILQELKK